MKNARSFQASDFIGAMLACPHCGQILKIIAADGPHVGTNPERHYLDRYWILTFEDNESAREQLTQPSPGTRPMITTTRSLSAVFALVALTACTQVHQTERCVGTRYGKVIEEKMDVGMNLTIFESATCFNLTDQNYPAESGGKETMEAQTRDPMTIEGDVAIVFAFDPASVYNVFLEKRSEDAAQVQVLNAIRDGYRGAIAGWTVADLFSARRATLGDSVKAHIQTKLGDLAKIKQVFIRDIRVPKTIEEARIASTKQELIYNQAKQQLAIDSMNARGQLIRANASAETNRLTSISYQSNPKMLDLEIAKALANLCGKATTCVIGASPNSLLGIAK